MKHSAALRTAIQSLDLYYGQMASKSSTQEAAELYSRSRELLNEEYGHLLWYSNEDSYSRD